MLKKGSVSKQPSNKKNWTFNSSLLRNEKQYLSKIRLKSCFLIAFKGCWLKFSQDELTELREICHKFQERVPNYLRPALHHHCQYFSSKLVYSRINIMMLIKRNAIVYNLVGQNLLVFTSVKFFQLLVWYIHHFLFFFSSFI